MCCSLRAHECKKVAQCTYQALTNGLRSSNNSSIWRTSRQLARQPDAHTALLALTQQPAVVGDTPCLTYELIQPCYRMIHRRSSSSALLFTQRLSCCCAAQHPRNESLPHFPTRATPSAAFLLCRCWD